MAEAGVTNITGWLLFISVGVMKHRPSLWAEDEITSKASARLSVTWCQRRLMEGGHNALVFEPIMTFVKVDGLKCELPSTPAALEMPFLEEEFFLVGCLRAYLVSNS